MSENITGTEMSWLFAFSIITENRNTRVKQRVRVIKFGICECNEIDIIGCTMYTMGEQPMFLKKNKAVE